MTAEPKVDHLERAKAQLKRCDIKVTVEEVQAISMFLSAAGVEALIALVEEVRGLREEMAARYVCRRRHVRRGHGRVAFHRHDERCHVDDRGMTHTSPVCGR
jgi:hypothetical protein